MDFYSSLTDISESGTIVVHIGKNAENEVDLIKSFSVFKWIFWDILFF